MYFNDHPGVRHPLRNIRMLVARVLCFDDGLIGHASAPDGRVDEKPWAAWAQMKAP